MVSSDEQSPLALRPESLQPPAPTVRIYPKQKSGQRRQRKHRFYRRHTPHYYLVVGGFVGAAAVSILDIAAFTSRSPLLAEISFAAVLLTAGLIFSAFFWGFYMLMNWRAPFHRLKFVIPHAAVGMLSPLIYTLNVSLELDSLGRSLPGWALAAALVSFALLCLQFSMGKAVVHAEPLRLVPPIKAGE